MRSSSLPPSAKLASALARFAAVLVLAAVGLVPAGAHAAPLLQSVEQLRNLSRAQQLELQKAPEPPVRLEGVVTYLREEEKGSNFNLDDGTGGLMVYLRTPIPLVPGQKVRVIGSPAFGRHGLQLRAHSVSAGDVSTLPSALPVTLAELLSGRMEGRFVEVDATVRRRRFEEKQVSPKRLALDLGSEARPLHAWITEFQGLEDRFLPGCRLRLRGVCLRFGNARGQGLSTVLLVNNADQVTLLAEATDPPLLPLPAVQEWTGVEDSAPRVSCEGIVTLLRPGELLVLQAGTRALRCRPLLLDPNRSDRAAWDCAVGDHVRIAGFPALGPYTLELESSAILTRQPGTLPDPEPISSIEQVTQGADSIDRDARLVRLEGLLKSVQRRPEACVLHLQAEGRSVEAHLPPGEPLPAALQEGALLSLVGVCNLLPLPIERRFGMPPSAFSLSVQDARSLSLLREGPWWNRTRLGTALGFTALASLGALLWAFRVRGRHRKLVREMHAQQSAQQLLHQDRQRLASELHDTLQQTLLAADLQLSAALRLPPDRLPEITPPVRLAHQLLARGREEMRDAIWAIQQAPDSTETVRDLLERLAQEITQQGPMRLTLHGPPEDIPLQGIPLANVSRILREALSNALKHARATALEIRWEVDPQHIHLEVRDNGVGFHPPSAPTAEQGHFGLSSMQERAARLGGQLLLESRPGAGTRIRLSFPLAPHA